MNLDDHAVSDVSSDVSQTHPMDHFPVRPLRFDVRSDSAKSPLWSSSSPEAAMFLNAFSVHVPYFERYLIRSMNSAKGEIQDSQLQEDIAAIIGQEANHARNFIEFNKFLVDNYPKIGVLERKAKAYFVEHADSDSLKTLVGFTAGYETFTFLAGMIVLAEYEQWMGDSDADIKALWVWHQVEEVEHGAVAFDVFKALYGSQEWYRKFMIARALTHITWEVVKAYYIQCSYEGVHRSIVRSFKAYGFLLATLTKMLANSLPTFSRSYHPREHPLVTTKQDPIAVAWRRYTAAGGDPLKIDREGMARILDVLPEGA